jgi:hypothetical protein
MTHRWRKQAETAGPVMQETVKKARELFDKPILHK